jgi:hypothetical protein
VHSQVGSAGFFLDLAVVDPALPGRYLLGIECDGARYHSARSARDRDRLRQTVLEGLGWRIHRVWSTDWFRHPEQELRKAVEAIERARLTTSTPVPKPETPTTPEPIVTEAVAAPPGAQKKIAVPYQCADVRLRLGNLDLHELERSELANALYEVVKVESPVHCSEAFRRVLSGAGVQRLGSRIQQAFDEALRQALHRRLFVQRGEFLWSVAMERAPLRDRSGLSASSRKLELVAADEIRRAIVAVVQQAYGISPDEIPAAVCKVLGFARVNDEMDACVCRHRDDLLNEGILVREGVNLVTQSVTSAG